MRSKLPPGTRPNPQHPPPQRPPRGTKTPVSAEPQDSRRGGSQGVVGDEGQAGEGGKATGGADGV
jgi:hypothetical protein